MSEAQSSYTVKLPGEVARPVSPTAARAMAMIDAATEQRTQLRGGWLEFFCPARDPVTELECARLLYDYKPPIGRHLLRCRRCGAWVVLSHPEGDKPTAWHAPTREEAMQSG